jgi:hypothetical protein
MVKESSDVEWQTIQAVSHQAAAKKVYGDVYLWDVRDWNGKECHNFSSMDDKHMYWVVRNTRQ